MNRFGPLCCNVFIMVSLRGAASPPQPCPSPSLKPLAGLCWHSQLTQLFLLLCIHSVNILHALHPTGPSLSWQYCNEAEIWAHQPVGWGGSPKLSFSKTAHGNLRSEMRLTLQPPQTPGSAPIIYKLQVPLCWLHLLHVPRLLFCSLIKLDRRSVPDTGCSLCIEH